MSIHKLVAALEAIDEHEYDAGRCLTSSSRRS